MALSKTRSALPLLGVACALAIAPAAVAAPAGDGPLRATLAASTTSLTESLRQTVRTTASGVRATVAPSVRAVAPGAGSQLRTAVQQVRAPVDRALAGASQPGGLVDSARSATTRLPGASSAPDGSVLGNAPRRAANGESAIDREAALRHGTFTALAGSPISIASLTAALPSHAAAEPRHHSSATAARSDRDAFDPDLPLGPFGTGGLSGPTGIALLAFAALLVGLLALAPRFAARMLQMSPSRWGPVAFLSPIERPG